MRYIALIILAVIGGFMIPQLGKIDPDNYVKVYLAGYVLEIKVLPFLFLLLLTVLSFYLIIRLVRVIWKSPKSYSNWRDKKAGQSAQAALGAGYLSLIKGDWKQAEKSLTTKSTYSGVPYVNYLAAAQAAQEQGKLTSRDEYLNAAYKEAPKERFAIGLTKARLHQNAGQLDQALATLQDIEADGAKNPQFTAMLMQTYEQMGDWAGVQQLLPTAKKQNALPDEVLEQIYNDVHCSSLRDAKDKTQAWNQLPRDQKKHAPNVAIYAADLISRGDNNGAEKLIRTTMKSIWSDELAHLYGAIQTDKPAKLLRTVEGWLLARPESAELNLAAGRFSLAQKDLEQAQDYLQKAVKYGQLPLAYSLLGQVFEEGGDSGKALQLYRAGMVSLSKLRDIEMAKVKLAHDTQMIEGDESQVMTGDLVIANKD